MASMVNFDNDYYVIGKDFKLVSFNRSVADRYPGIRIGDLCYKATMNRDTPCLHCPLAGNSDSNSPIYYDPAYNGWAEAILVSWMMINLLLFAEWLMKVVLDLSAATGEMSLKKKTTSARLLIRYFPHKLRSSCRLLRE